MGKVFHVPLFTLTEWRENAGASQKRGQLWIIMLLLKAIVLRLSTNYIGIIIFTIQYLYEFETHVYSNRCQK